MKLHSSNGDGQLNLEAVPWKDFLEAIEHGLTEEQAADFAGIVGDADRRALQGNAQLRAAVRKSRAEGMLNRIKKAEESSSWQSQEFLLTNLWHDTFTAARNPSAASWRYPQLLQTIASMSADQLDRLPELLETAVRVDNKQKPSRISDQADAVITA